MTGEVRADNTRQLLVHSSRRCGRTQRRRPPLLLVLEDAHWFDSASWALARRWRAGQPLLLVLATRPLAEPLPDEYRAAPPGPGHRALRLEPLGPRRRVALVGQRLGVGRLPEPVARLIQERAQGNPFFSEELAYALRDAGLIRSPTAAAPRPGAGDLST